MQMKGFIRGMMLGAVAGAAADMAMRSAVGKNTAAGRTARAVTDAVEALRTEGKTVSAQRSIPEKLRYATLCDLRKEATT